VPNTHSSGHRSDAAAMRVEVRAVILIGDRLLVNRQRQLDGLHFSLPGGRVDRGEDVETALRREVDEEAGIEISIGPLLYVAEVISERGLCDLNLVFRAYPIDQAPSLRPGMCDLVDIENPHVEVRPPLLDRIRVDAADGWVADTRWLGNLWDPGSRPEPAA
jgi:ADP-ribose pyrophosphatase YjhB (NUDIX family)